MPSSAKDVSDTPVKSIDFIETKRSLTCTSRFGNGEMPSLSPSSIPTCRSRSPTPSFEDATNVETRAFFASFGTCVLDQKKKTAILSWGKPYASNYIAPISC